MAKNKVKTKFNLKGLDKFSKGIKEKYFVKVGLIGGKGKELHQGSNSNNATIGLVHEFGSKTKKIPQRSFLRMPIEKKSKDIIKLIGTASKSIMKNIAEGNVQFLYERIGLAAETVIMGAFPTSGYGQWLPLSTKTISKKGSSRPLIDTGQLARAITSKVVKKL